MEDGFAQGLVGVTLDGRYRLDAVLGEGGMGSVFRATHLAMDRKVAVKLLKPHLTAEPTALERFAREARATMKVDSPHAVKVLDFGITPQGDYYMVLEYLDGRTAQKELEVDGPFAPDRVAHLAAHALDALGAAHARGLVHRDVKPDNLLLMRVGDDPDYTKVLDFGVAKLMQRTAEPAELTLTGAGMVFGTPEFMSPEQACGLELDGRSDLYSLAATMYVLLTGAALFEGASAIELHESASLAPLAGLSAPSEAASAYVVSYLDYGCGTCGCPVAATGGPGWQDLSSAAASVGAKSGAVSAIGSFARASLKRLVPARVLSPPAACASIAVLRSASLSANTMAPSTTAATELSLSL